MLVGLLCKAFFGGGEGPVSQDILKSSTKDLISISNKSIEKRKATKASNRTVKTTPAFALDVYRVTKRCFALKKHPLASHQRFQPTDTAKTIL